MIRELSVFNTFKEKTLIEIKSLKNVIETTKKMSDQQLDLESKNLKDIIKKTIEINNLKFESDIEGFTQRVNDVKLENAKYHIQTIKMSQELKEDMTELIEFKTNYKEKYSLKVSEFKSQEAEIEKIKKELKSLNEKLKENQASIKETQNYTNSMVNTNISYITYTNNTY